ncbi:MAG TPA: hypothetical protein VK307_00890 [Thermoleophilaceae bacterium]|nr:hypothetical protein [Thermoleophilaceae bacterium]
MVVALTALFVALGGSAYALVITGKSIRNNTVRNVDIRNHTLLARDHKRDSLGGETINEFRLGTVPGAAVAEGASHYAVVTQDGILARGRGLGLAPAARTGVGRYQVITNRDVRGCVYIATVGDPSAAGAPGASDVTTSALGSNVNAVAVRTWNDNGNPADRPFHLVVLC